MKTKVVVLFLLLLAMTAHSEGSRVQPIPKCQIRPIPLKATPSVPIFRLNGAVTTKPWMDFAYVDYKTPIPEREKTSIENSIHNLLTGNTDDDVTFDDYGRIFYKGYAVAVKYASSGPKDAVFYNAQDQEDLNAQLISYIKSAQIKTRYEDLTEVTIEGTKYPTYIFAQLVEPGAKPDFLKWDETDEKNFISVVRSFLTGERILDALQGRKLIPLPFEILSDSRMIYRNKIVHFGYYYLIPNAKEYSFVPAAQKRVLDMKRRRLMNLLIYLEKKITD